MKLEQEMELKHFGVLGMKWGVRRNQNAHPDQSSVSGIMKMRPKKMSDDQLANATKRQQLLNDYYKTHGGQLGMLLSGKKAKSLSNEELKIESERKRLEKEFYNSVTYRQMKRAGIKWKTKTKDIPDDLMRTEILRSKLNKADGLFKKGVTKTKPIKDMSPNELKSTMERYNKEQSFKKVRLETIENGLNSVATLVYIFSDTPI